MNFGEAFKLLHAGQKLSRTAWNDVNVFVFIVPGSTFKVNRPPLLGIFEEGTEVVYRSHIDMKYADGTIGVYLVNSNDVLATDWEQV